MTYIYILFIWINKQISRLVLIFAMLFCLIFISLAYGTTLIAVRTAKEVFLAADSMMIKGGEIRSACKIIQVEDMFISFGGKPIFPQYQFDAIRSADDIFSRKDTFRNNMETYIALIKWQLTPIIDKMRKDVKLFNDYFHAPNRFIFVLIVSTIEADSPVFYEITFYVNSSHNEPAIIKSVIRDSTKRLIGSQREILIEGEQSEILDSIDKNALDKPDFDPIKNIIKWIRLEATANPDKVRLPIDILRITKDRAEWIQHKPECKEIEQKFFKHSN